LTDHTKISAIAAAGCILFPTFMSGTTVVVFVTNAGIVLSADSKTTLRDSNFSSTGEIEQPKLTIVQNRIVITTIGVSDIAAPSGHYNFLQWIKTLQAQIGDHASVAVTSDIIEKESAAVFAKLKIASLIQSGALKNKSPADPCETFAKFVIAGYEDESPRVYEIYFYIDWNRHDFVGPVKVQLYPDSEVSNYRILRFGTQQAIVDVLNEKSYAHQQAMSLCPLTMSKIKNGIYPSLDDTISLSRVLIKIEEDTNPSEVGGSITTVKILPDGIAREVTGVGYP
jgi:hypothetical protein